MVVCIAQGAESAKSAKVPRQKYRRPGLVEMDKGNYRRGVWVAKKIW